MKNLIKAFFAVLFVTAICACTLQEPPDSNTFGSINISAETVREQFVTDVPGTKTTLSGNETHWIADTDKIGVFSPEARTTDGGETPVNNGEFTAQTSAKSSAFTGTMYWGANEDHHFYACYPRNSEYSGDQTAVPISLSSAQTQSAAGNTDHIGALDFMVATPRTVAYGGAVNFTFNHVFSMIEFQIKGSGNLTQVRLSGANPLAFSSGTIDLTQTPSSGTPYTITKNSTSKSVNVSFNSPIELSGSAVSIYMMVLPGTQSEMTVTLIIDNNWKELFKDAPTGGFERGKKYEIALDSDSGSAGWNSTLTDQRDSKTYNTVVIGGQIWMTENLAYLTSVNNYSAGSEDAGHETEPFYYVYGYDGTDLTTAKATANYSTYGVLYNWTAAMNGASSSSSNPSSVQGVCPTGWHLPTDAEWIQLQTYLAYNGYNYDGTIGGDVNAKIAKSLATDTGWSASSNTGAVGNTDYPEYRNKSGFSGLPGGQRLTDRVQYVGQFGYCWSAIEKDATYSWAPSLRYLSASFDILYIRKSYANSVRCLKD